MRFIAIVGGVAAPLVVFVPGFMQRGEAWAPVADLLSQRYSSVLLDHAEHDREGRLREIAEAAGTGGAVLCGYSLGGPAGAAGRAARALALPRRW